MKYLLLNNRIPARCAAMRVAATTQFGQQGETVVATIAAATNAMAAEKLLCGVRVDMRRVKFARASAYTISNDLPSFLITLRSRRWLLQGKNYPLKTYRSRWKQS